MKTGVWGFVGEWRSRGWKMGVFPCLVWWKWGRTEKGVDGVFHLGPPRNLPPRLGGKMGEKMFITWTFIYSNIIFYPFTFWSSLHEEISETFSILTLSIIPTFFIRSLFHSPNHTRENWNSLYPFTLLLFIHFLFSHFQSSQPNKPIRKCTSTPLLVAPGRVHGPRPMRYIDSFLDFSTIWSIQIWPKIYLVKYCYSRWLCEA